MGGFLPAQYDNKINFLFLRGFGNVFLDFIALCNRSDRNIASYYDKNIGKMERAIDKVVDTLESMD